MHSSRKSALKSRFSKICCEWLGVLSSTSQLQVDLKIFPGVERFFNKLLRHCPGPGECSEHRFMVIRHVEQKWRGKNRVSWKNTKNFKHVKVLTCASLSGQFRVEGGHFSPCKNMYMEKIVHPF